MRSHRVWGVVPPYQSDQSDDGEDDNRTGQHDRREEDDPKGDKPSDHDEGTHGSTTPFPECSEVRSSSRCGRSRRAT
jgi:hypothetical protein